MLHQLKKKIISYVPPHQLRKWLHGGKRKALAQKILSDYSEKQVNEEIKNALEFIKKHGVDYIPYDYSLGYKYSDIKVYRDHPSGLKYVLFKNKKLFFKHKWNDLKIRDACRQLFVEQDEQSPHRYLDKNFKLNKGDIIADIGAAEGIFTLEYIDIVDKAYLFECDPDWIEPLRNTFAPFGNKVQIIEKMVSDKDDDSSVTIDQFTQNNKIDFYKIDVDGGEDLLLTGGYKTFRSMDKLRVALCTYHEQGDLEKYQQWFACRGFRVQPTGNFLLFLDDQNLSFPYFRRAVIQCTK